MALLLGLASAALFGTGDFFGGMAAKRCSVLHVVAISHLIGLIGIGFAAVLIGNPINGPDLARGSIGGLAGLVGVALLYRLLSVGPMSVVAPLTALTSAAVPAIWGLAGGERFSSRSWLGIVLALVAIGLASSEIGNKGGASATPVTVRVVAESLLSGSGFGLFFIFLDSTSSSSTPWAIVAARTTTTTLLFLVAVVVTRTRIPELGRSSPDQQRSRQARQLFPTLTAAGWLLLAGAGIADTGANLTFLYATQVGELTLVSVLASLYPIMTVGLARIFIGEKMGPLRASALALAVVAAQLLSTG